MTPLISIIVPVYNLRALIAKSIESLIAQDYKNLEIIVVDDCSSDNSADEAEMCLSKSSRQYKILRHEKNRGVSAARNTGIKVAQGEFFTVFDGDDLCDSNMITLLYTKAVKILPHADITICGHRTLDETTGKTAYYPIKNYESLEKQTTQEAVAARILNRFEPSLSTLYKTTVIRSNNIEYTEGCSAGEDGEFFLKALIVSNNISAIADTPYIYVQHAKMGSWNMKRTIRAKRYRDNAYAIMRTYQFIKPLVTTKKLKKIVDCLLFPEACFRLLSAAAQNGNKEEFLTIKKSISPLALLRSRHIFCIKPEYFLKSLFFLAMPSTYFSHYNKRRI